MAQVFLQLNSQSGTIRYINAGCPSIIVRHDSTATILQKGNSDFSPPLGVMRFPLDQNGNSVFHEEQAVSLKSGDMVLVYTDGLLELLEDNPRERLCELLEAVNSNGELDKVARELMQKINVPKSGQVVRDDQTFVLIRCK